MIDELVLIDWISVALLATFGITGLFNGFIKEFFSAAAWIISLTMAWLWGPSLFPLIEAYIGETEITKAVSFLALFISCFLVLKFLGSLLSILTSVIGLKVVDKGLGFCFGTLKVAIVLTSLYVYNLDFLDNKKWWLDSLTREYIIQIIVMAEPIFRDWQLWAPTFLNKDNLNLDL